MSLSIDTALKDGLTLDTLRARYMQLAKVRDAINEEIAPLKAEREKLNTQIQELNAQINKLTDQINAKRGGAKWIQLKREIGGFAKMLGGR